MSTLVVSTEAELRSALHSAYDSQAPVYLAGVAPGRVPPGEGLVLDIATRGVDINTEGCHVDDLVFCGAVTATLAAGEPWRDFVALAVQSGWGGVEALAGVPGTVAEVVTANPSRFGQSPADAVSRVRTWDRATDAQRTFAMVECEFEPGSSRFSRETLPDGTQRYVVIEAALLLKQADITPPLHDEALVAALGIEPGERVPLGRVHDLALGAAEADDG